MRQFFASLLVITMIISLNSCITTAQVDNHSIENKQAHYTIEIQYPQVDDKSKHSTPINKQIHSIITKTQEEFVQICNDYYDDTFFYSPWTLYINWTLVEINSSRFSAILETYSYTGGAHGITFLQALNFDLKTGREISLESFAKTISPNTDFSTWLDDLSKKSFLLAQQELENRNKDHAGYKADLAWISEGTSATIENYSVFTLSEDTIHFYFGQYQIAPYSQGITKISIPIQELETF